MSRLQDRLKSLRHENNLSRNALAEKIGSSQKIIDYWEKGTSKSKAHFIIALADCFGVTADFILGREDDFGNVNVKSDLTEKEKILVSAYGRAGNKEKETLLQFAKFLTVK